MASTKRQCYWCRTKKWKEYMEKALDKNGHWHWSCGSCPKTLKGKTRKGPILPNADLLGGRWLVLKRIPVDNEVRLRRVG